VTAKLWFERDGSIQRTEIIKASDDAEVNQELQRKLAKLKRFNEAPPEGAVSPIKVEFVVGAM
jgi:hypothetical protein